MNKSIIIGIAVTIAVILVGVSLYDTSEEISVIDEIDDISDTTEQKHYSETLTESANIKNP